MLELKITTTAKDGTPLGTTVAITDLIVEASNVYELTEIALNGLRKVIEAYKNGGKS